MLRQTLLSSLGAADEPGTRQPTRRRRSSACQRPRRGVADTAAVEIEAAVAACHRRCATDAGAIAVSRNRRRRKLLAAADRVDRAERLLGHRRRTRATRRCRAQSAAGSAAGTLAGNCAESFKQVCRKPAGNRQSVAGIWRCRTDGRNDDVTRPHQHAAAAVSRRVAIGAAGCCAIDRTRCAARNRRAASARRHRRRDRAADAAAGGLVAGSGRYDGVAARSDRAALEFRNSVCDAAGNGDGAVRDFARRRRQRGRGGQAGLAGAVLARRRAGRPGSCSWCRSAATGPRCGCGRNGPRPRSNCAPAPRSSARP